MPQSVTPTQANITHTLHLKVSTGPPLLREIHRLGNSDFVAEHLTQVRFLHPMVTMT